ncbi:MAG: hypothetical protein M3O86_01920 [Actinomycetota bacterium]|nr:hypothetical protein [Actinomycetota bacterium]
MSGGSPLSFVVPGIAIAGEDPRERAWRAQVAAAARAAGARRASGLVLSFGLTSDRIRIDIDNLARPALDAMRDAGVATRGFIGVDAVLATKRTDVPPGLTVLATTAQTVRDIPCPGEPLISVAARAVPRDGDRDSKLLWREAVSTVWSGRPVLTGPAFVDVTLRTSLSLKNALKPLVDGLEPVLGRDPHGRLEFCPNDDLVTWLRVMRADGLAPVVMRLGRCEL